jgi:TolA-binding protein
MKYRDKVIFGIFEDNPSFKIVQMRWYNGTAMLVNLQKTMLEKSFYADRPNQEIAAPDVETDLQLSSVLKFDETSSPVDEESGIGETQVTSPESKLLDSFALDEGRIALNANDERLTVYPLSISAQSKGLIRAIRKDILKPEDRKNKQIVYGVIPQIGDVCTVMVHRGVNNLLDYLWRYNRAHTVKRFFYTLMDPNDVSLVNILNVNYDFPEEANVLILYLGFEYKKGILVKNNALLKSFPIQTASNLFTNRDEIYSKLMLEQDEAQLPDPQYIILAGENSKNDDVTYFQKKFPKSEVSRMFFKNMLVGEDAPDPITDEDLAEYAIPIALAWKTMDSGNKKFINTNFLQKKILEGQKIFKLAWHGFIILFLLFFYTAYSTKNFLIHNNNLVHLKTVNVMLESEYRSYKGKVESNMAGLMSVASLQGQQQKILELLKGKNEWGYILSELANSVGNHPASWIVNLKSEKESFTVIGKTTKRTNILVFSQLFPDGKILKVTNEKLGKTLIWNFEMSFSYPKLETVLKGQTSKTVPAKENTTPAVAKANNLKTTEKPIVTTSNKPQEEKKKIIKEKIPDKTTTPAKEQTITPKPASTKAVVTPLKPPQEKKKTTVEKAEVKNQQPVEAVDKGTEDYENLRAVYDKDKNEVVLAKAKQFIEKYPNHPYVYFSKYMMGESMYMLNDYKGALQIFDQIIAENKKKTPDAYYMKGACNLALKDTLKAKENFKIVVEKYPKSDVARKARKKLEVLP